MKIIKMHATFGKLREQTLELSEGMNVLYGENEAGKSTWSAFLRVMLYGISTREKSKTGFLSDKERYAPWSGEPMYGKIEFLWNGKHHILERVAGKNGILQAAKITETDSGRVLDIAEPVGETLLGIRREVFERTAFIAQSALAISADKNGELEKRICALTTSGEEDVSQKQVLERLEKQKRKLKYYKKGEIPELEERLSELEEKILSARNDAAQLTAQYVAIEELGAREKSASEKILLRQAISAKEELDYINNCESALLQCEEALREHRQNSNITTQQRVEIEEKLIQYEEIDRKYTESIKKEDDGRKKLRASIDFAKKRNPAFIVAAGVSAVLFAIAAIFLKVAVAGAAAILAFFISFFITNHQFYRKCGVKNKKELETKKSEQIRCEQTVAILAEETQKLLAQRGAAKEMLDSVLRMIETDLSARELIDSAKAHEERERELENEYAKLTATARAACVGRDITALERKAENLPCDVECPNENIEQLERERQEVRTERERRSGLMAALEERILARGELPLLETQKDEIKEKLYEKNKALLAIELAIKTFSDIQTELQRKFAPGVEKRAAEIFKTLTGGHFGIVHIVDAQINLTVAENDAAPPRKILELSGGTLDELYLSVRIALCEQLLSPEVPIILDDVLVNFDDKRATCALELLSEQAKARQILVFTCHTRECDYAKQRGIANTRLPAQ